MQWFRQNLVPILIGAFVALQAAMVGLQTLTLFAVQRNQYVSIEYPSSIAEAIARELRSDPLKVAICDERGRECVGTAIVSSVSFGRSYTQRGLVVTDPERKN